MPEQQLSPSSSYKEKLPRVVHLCRWLFPKFVALDTVVVLGLFINVGSTWLTSSRGSIPPDSPLRWLLAFWPITLPIGCCLLLLELLTWTVSRWPIHAIPPLSLAQQNRVYMLGRLQRSYNDLRTHLLQGAVWMDLELTQKLDAVRNLPALLLRSSNQPEHPLPPGTSILDAYDQSGHGLLILGEPGSGKSTLLLDLAQRLVQKAEADEAHLLPIILPLASWAVKRPPLRDWIVEQLTQLYDIPRYLSEQWVREGTILPLLDGLDEMDEAARPACIVAINAYHQKDLVVPLVVCSRKTEYEAAAAQQPLALQSAVVVQPLTREQVDAYLFGANTPLQALRRALKKNAILYDLATTPLMLNVLMLTYQGTAVRELSRKQAQLQSQIWNDYIKRMVEYKGDKKRYPLKQTRSWLSWLAQQMRMNNQAVFYLELMQPDCLTDGDQRTYTWLGTRLPSILIGGFVCVLLQLLFFYGGDRRNLVLFGVMGGLLGGLLSPSVMNEGEQRVEKPHHGWKARIALSFFIGVVVGVNEGWGFDTTLLEWVADGLLFGVVFGLSCLLLQQVILASLYYVSSVSRTIFTTRWSTIARVIERWHIQRALWTAVVFGLSFGLGNGLHNGLRIGLNIGLRIGLSFGLTSILIGAILERYGKEIHLTERLTWTRQSLRNGLLSFTHVRLSLLLIGCIIVLVGLSYGLSYGLNEGLLVGLSEGLGDGLSVGLSYWLLVGLYHSVTQEQMENRDRRVANQGIRRSFRNSALMGLIGGEIIGGTMVLGVWMSDGLNYGLREGLREGLNYGLNYGLRNGLSLLPSLVLVSIFLIWMVSGGLAVWRHYVIRYLLARIHSIPWKAPQFLDDATARILLQHVGGGYSFTHRLLLDYFANLDANES